MSTINYDELAAVAQNVAKTNIVPQGLRGRWEEVFAVMAYGAEIGLAPMTSLQQIDSVQGRPTLNAQGQRGIVLRAGHDLEVVEATAERAVVRGRRCGSDLWQEASFTIDEAKQAGLTGKGPWKTHTADMLVARASTRLIRRAFPDLMGGIAYDADELGASTTVEGRVVAAPQQAALPPAASVDLEGWGSDQERDDAHAALAADVRALPSDEDKAAVKAWRTERGLALPLSAVDFAELQAFVGTLHAQPTSTEAADTVVADADVVDATYALDQAKQAGMLGNSEPLMSEAQQKRIFALLKDLEVGNDERHQFAAGILGHEVTSFSFLTRADANRFIDHMAASLEPARVAS